MLHSAIVQCMRPVTKHISLSDVRYLRFPSQLLPRSAVCFIVPFFFLLRAYIASCRACLYLPLRKRPPCHGPIQTRQKQRRSSSYSGRRNSTSRYSMLLPTFGLAVRRAARLSACYFRKSLPVWVPFTFFCPPVSPPALLS